MVFMNENKNGTLSSMNEKVKKSPHNLFVSQYCESALKENEDTDDRRKDVICELERKTVADLKLEFIPKPILIT